MQELFKQIQRPSGHSLVVVHNLKKERLRHNQISKLLNNEFDLIVLDPMHGAWIVEVKNMPYVNSRKFNIVKEKQKQEKRYEFVSQIRRCVSFLLKKHFTREV